MTIKGRPTIRFGQSIASLCDPDALTVVLIGGIMDKKASELVLGTVVEKEENRIIYDPHPSKRANKIAAKTVRDYIDEKYS